MGGAEEQPRVIRQQALGFFGGEFFAQPARVRRKTRVNPRRGIEHRIEDFLFRELRTRLVVACRQKAAEVLASGSYLVIVMRHPDSRNEKGAAGRPQVYTRARELRPSRYTCRRNARSAGVSFP